MHTYRITIDPDGRATIPDTHPGQTVTIHLGEPAEPLTLATARTEEERDQIVAGIRQAAREIRSQLPEPWLSGDHGDLLYGDDGLPE